MHETYDDSICPISHSLFIKKKVLFLHLLKEVLCVTREQLTFSDSDDDFEHREAFGAQVNHSCSIIILARKSQFSSLVAQCTIASSQTKLCNSNILSFFKSLQKHDESCQKFESHDFRKCLYGCVFFSFFLGTWRAG